MKTSYPFIQKLNKDGIPIMAQLTGVQMNLLIYVMMRSDGYGVSDGISYADVIRDTGMCKESFYDAVRVFEKLPKDFIEIQHDADEATYTFTIPENDFHKGDFSKGYVNLQKKIFHSDKFKKLKAPEKFLVFYFLMCTHKNRATHREKVGTLYSKLMKYFGVTKRVVRSYLHSLKAFFSMGAKMGCTM